MGNCPSEFTVAPSGFACVMQCPTSKNYQLVASGQNLSCMYNGDSSISVPLRAVPMYQSPREIVSYNDLPNKQTYVTEVNRFNDALAIANAKIDAQVKIQTAFKTLQDAEAVRDQAPDAYQQARIGYYTLLKGDTWLNDEKQRVAATEAQPIVNQYINKYTTLTNQDQQQKSTINLVNGVKDKVLSVQDELQYSVDAFSRQIGDIKNQINIERHKKAQELINPLDWVDVFLNILLVLGILVAIYYVFKAVMKSRVQPSMPVTSPTT
jgi:hypothetical protein